MSIAILEGIHALNGKLVAKTSMHAIYDDHDFGMDDCVPGSLVDEPKWKKHVLANFSKNWNNPPVGGGTQNPIVGRLFLWVKCNLSCLIVDTIATGRKNQCWVVFRKNGSRIHCNIRMPLLKLLPRRFLFRGHAGSRDPWDGYPEERRNF